MNAGVRYLQLCRPIGRDNKGDHHPSISMCHADTNALFIPGRHLFVPLGTQLKLVRDVQQPRFFKIVTNNL